MSDEIVPDEKQLSKKALKKQQKDAKKATKKAETKALQDVSMVMSWVSI